jgi:hypothetical protein
MDAFEQIVARVFEVQGYWTQIGFKVELTKEQKRSLGNPSMPRPEIDIIAYKPVTNELLIIECKSYLDSYGIRTAHFDSTDNAYSKTLKLFNRPDLRNLVISELVLQLKAQGLLASDPKVQLCLVAGKIYSQSQPEIEKICIENGWRFMGPAQIAENIRKFASRGYENDAITMITKILDRN